MKIRTDFVTNSSSSSFVLIRINSKTVKDIVEEFKGSLFGVHDENGHPDYNAMYNINNGEGNEIEIMGEEVWGEVPNSKDQIPLMLSTLFGEDFYPPDREDFDTEEEYQEELRAILEEAEEEGMGDAAKYARKILANSHKILEDVESVEWTFNDYGWGGDDDTRFYPDSYDEETLAEMYECIAEQNGCSVEDVTDDDFSEYVCNGQSNSETTFYYDKKTGEEKVIHDYQVEIF
jgi:hypothetical protein